MNNAVSNSYSELEIVKASDVPELIEQCSETSVNLLIYGEPGCGKSAIIEQLASTGDYFLVQLGAASLCEEMINGIPVHDAASNTIKYDKPDWLVRIQSNHKSDPTKKQILFIDELTLAKPEVSNSLQLLLTARAVPTHPSDVLPSNVVIVSATNTAEDTNEGCELSRPLKTRFMSVRMTNSPSEYREYIRTVQDKVMSNIKNVLGEQRFEQFIDDAISDFGEHWCDNSKFYGTNPRTIMNFFKVCDYKAKKDGEFTVATANAIAKRTTGHELVTTHWTSEERTIAKQSQTKLERKDIYPTNSDLEAMTLDELVSVRTTIYNSPKARTMKAVDAICRINEQILKKQKEQF